MAAGPGETAPEDASAVGRGTVGRERHEAEEAARSAPVRAISDTCFFFCTVILLLVLWRLTGPLWERFREGHPTNLTPGWDPYSLLLELFNFSAATPPYDT